MYIKHIIIIAISVVFISACAGQKVVNGKVVNNKGKICKYEKVTGSHIGTKVCKTKQQMESEREAAKQIIKRSTASSPAGMQ